MKKNVILFLLMLFLSSPVLRAAEADNMRGWHTWAFMVMEEGQKRPEVKVIVCKTEQAGNGSYYRRASDLLYGDTGDPMQTQYGYRIADKKIFIYDFKQDEEHLAFDFTLSPGDGFTTYNGVEWNVESVQDTLVNISETHGDIEGEPVPRRLLKVRSIDGRLTDQWLEGFGSFRNFLMIEDVNENTYSQLLWMEHRYGCYLAREINDDPFFTHDSGWMEGHYNFEDEPAPMPNCRYENGNVVFEHVQWAWEHREYACYYRVGDDIYMVESRELKPHVDDDTRQLYTDVITFAGLPAPQSGNYTIHLGDDTYATGINKVVRDVPMGNTMYDLHGRKLPSEPSKGIYIRQGQKIVVK